MAQMIPEYFRSGTRGETILFNTLKGLPDDYVVYREGCLMEGFYEKVLSDNVGSQKRLCR